MLDLLTLQRTLTSLIESLPPAQVQNRIMACNDRDVALSLSRMDQETIEKILGMIARSKADRIREEIRLQESRHVEHQHIAAALRTIVQSLERNRSVAGQRSYLRPRRNPGIRR